MVINQRHLFKNIRFYKSAHNLGPRRSPDMILTPFDVKFHEKKDAIPPGACRLSKRLKTNNVEKVDPQQVNKNNVEKVDHQQVEKKQCRESGFIYLHIP